MIIINPTNRIKITALRNNFTKFITELLNKYYTMGSRSPSPKRLYNNDESYEI